MSLPRPWSSARVAIAEPAPMVDAGAVREAAAAANPWISSDYLRANGDRIMAALTEHIALTTQAMLLAVLVGLPLAVMAHWIRPLSGPILAAVGVIYTVPALAVFAFVAPYLGVTTRSVVIPLALYALLMIVRNSLTGLLQVPADVRDAARGMGYGRWALLLRVELPLALPGILTGVRLATVGTVAMTTIGVLVGHGGLGQLILGGFRNNFFRAEILTGVVLCVGVALVADLLLLAAGRCATPWRRRQEAW